MKIVEAKAIPIDELLENLGHVCMREVGGRKWYKRPYGNERTASFVLSADKHAWYDHGEGVGGNILDLAIKYANLDGISEALKFIELSIGPGYIIPDVLPEFKSLETNVPYYELISAIEFSVYCGQSLSNTAKYLISRGIDPKAVAPYLKDVKFISKEDRNKIYSGFGIPNNSSGFEVRRGGDWIKTSVGHKDVSAFFADRDFAPWHTFYSMMDFCTFLTIDKPPINTYNYLIINGDGLVEKAEHFIQSMPVGTMIHYPHNDASGQKAYERLSQFTANNGWHAGNRSHLYKGFKDWNEAIQISNWFIKI